MRLADRIIIKALAYSIRNGQAGQVAEIRSVFDEKYKDRAEEWRRDMWRQAAEQAQGKVSR